MSFHKNPKYQIPELIQSLKDHGLKHDRPDQLADSFRIGWVAALAATQAVTAAPQEGVSDLMGSLARQLGEIGAILKYPEEWDTAVYPTLVEACDAMNHAAFCHADNQSFEYPPVDPQPPASALPDMGNVGAETLSRAADFLEWYAAFIKESVMSVDIERHPYLPELEGIAEEVRALSKSAALPPGRGMVPMTDWRPIETAPTDGTRFLAYQADRESPRYECWWQNDFSNWSGWQTDWDDEPAPTHWMPLPPAPGSGALGDGGREA